jgi:hypothetical protein
MFLMAALSLRSLDRRRHTQTLSPADMAGLKWPSLRE